MTRVFQEEYGKNSAKGAGRLLEEQCQRNKMSMAKIVLKDLEE